MIIDSSALLAIVLNEPERDSFLDAIVSVDRRSMSVANWFEATMVIDRRGKPQAVSYFEEFVGKAGIDLVPVTSGQANRAREAWRIYGRGVHPAKLNYGDCFAYALAKEREEPLLFKGEDFPQTDIEPALKV